MLIYNSVNKYGSYTFSDIIFNKSKIDRVKEQ